MNFSKTFQVRREWMRAAYTKLKTPALGYLVDFKEQKDKTRKLAVSLSSVFAM